MPAVAPPRQRPELTFRHNLSRGRHGWLWLTPAYSVRLVEERLAHIEPGARVLDPFSGSGTTALCAAERGSDATGLDVNPFLVWLGRAKVRSYAAPVLAAAEAALAQVVSGFDAAPLAPEPPIHRIDRWWAPEARVALCRLSGAIEAAAGDAPEARDLLRVAFCQTLIALSNAAFNHPSMSFGAAAARPDAAAEACAVFSAAASAILASAAGGPTAAARIIEGDARTLEALGPARFDRVITSPPYPNRMSYIRELRPYMYWLGYLAEAREAGELDWRAIGGTWGVATSRLARFSPDPKTYRPPGLKDAVDRVERAHPRNGPLLARYVDRYFEDTFAHLGALSARLTPGARIDYIVGNSSFYGVLIPVERIYADMFAELGYAEVGCEVVRKRNSNKALYEFCLSAVKRA